MRPSIYALENALAVTAGIFLPEDPTLFIGKERYLRDIIFEINLCYKNGAYNACSVLLRRLLETLIIKAHQRAGSLQNVTKTNGNIYSLEDLIADVVSNKRFSLSRNAYDAMPHLKRLGDWGAHNPNVLIRKVVDLDPIKDKSRLCVEELLNKV